MNDGLFANYENLFSGNSFQSSDIPTSIFPIIDNELPPTTHYFSCISSDPSQQQQQQQQQLINIPSSSLLPLDITPTTTTTTTTINTSGPMNTVGNSFGNSIPFVQIHTTDVQPQRSSYGNVFRRTTSNNHHEIKSELIKSENSDATKDRTNTTPTPPARSASGNGGIAGSILPTIVTNDNSGSIENVTSAKNLIDSPVTAVLSTVLKCNLCPYITLSNDNLNDHHVSVHTNGTFSSGEEIFPPRILCPGCPNIFYTYNTLELHLCQDHMMNVAESKQLMASIKQTTNKNDEHTTKANENHANVGTNSVPPKSRIYLKNVECLREPRREPIEQQENQITDNNCFQMTSFDETNCNALINEAANDFMGMLDDEVNHDENDNIENNITNINNTLNTQKQKISIKSVDVLREPALLRRDFEMQNLSNFVNSCSAGADVLDLHTIGANHSGNEQFNYPMEVNGNSNNNNDICNSNNNNNTSTNIHTNNETACISSAASNLLNTFEKPRRPKIYIKNVDILKEPMVLTSNATNIANIQEPNSAAMNFNFTLTQTIPNVVTNNSNFMNNSADTNNAPVFDMSSMSSIYENSNNNFIPTINDDENENYGFISTQNAQNFVMDNHRFIETNGLDCGLDSLHQSECTPMITEPTPPPLAPQPPPPPATPASSTLLQSFTMENNSILSTHYHHHQPQQKQKIFIKNVDILKEPQFQEHHRGTLHLRTVDELNLMNRNEVQDLIAPNLDNNIQFVISSNEDDLNDNFSCTMDNSQLPKHGDHDADDHNADRDAIPADDTATTAADDGDADILNNMDQDNDIVNDVVDDGDPLCEVSNFKLQDFDAHVVNSWTVDDYDLRDDIDCYITQASSNSLKALHDLETPQMSLISIRDIEELTVTPQHQPPIVSSSTTYHQDVGEQQNHQQSISQMQSGTKEDQDLPCTANNMATAICDYQNHIPMDVEDNHIVEVLEGEEDELKQEQISNVAQQKKSTIGNTKVLPSSVLMNDIHRPVPPLVPVSTGLIVNMNIASTAITSTSTTTAVAMPTIIASDHQPSVVTSIPVPPLVPVSPMIQLKPSTAVPPPLPPPPLSTILPTTATTTTVERARIYVANNLMQDASNRTSAVVPVIGGTSIRGRPFGAKRTGVAAKARKSDGTNPTEPLSSSVSSSSAASALSSSIMINGAKCPMPGCAFRFQKLENLDYHKRCHNSDSSATSSQAIICPECKSCEFNNWNTLHTHLWRSHQIDMELYSCTLCSFKTPIYSRLINTHAKIHSDERNHPCDKCDKAFKNTKQLKNHRRWHRKNAALVAAKEADPNLYRCKDCGRAFSHQKTVLEHFCNVGGAQVQCDICKRVLSSKSSLKLHMLTHDTVKRFQCELCNYTANDHNSFRRHKMMHDNTKRYKCPHCSYKSIQSIAYQKHVQQKHPEHADSIIYKCHLCPFSTINRTLLAVHQTKHDTTSTTAAIVQQQNVTESIICTEEATIVQQKALNTDNDVQIQKTKIKVKSNLLLT